MMSLFQDPNTGIVYQYHTETAPSGLVPYPPQPAPEQEKVLEPEQVEEKATPEPRNKARKAPTK